MNHPNVQATDNRPIIKCESVYKIFGENSKRMLQQVNGQVDTKQFQAAGLVVGVNNASFEVSKGEMLVIMGLSGSGKSTLLRCISRLSDRCDDRADQPVQPDPPKPGARRCWWTPPGW